MQTKFNTEIIKEYMTLHNLNKSKFCAMCNISISTFNKIMNNNTKVSAQAFYNIGLATKLSIDEIINTR